MTLDRLDTSVYSPGSPTKCGKLRLDEVHVMHWEEYGHDDGVPILILHGGPGGAVKPYYRQLIDPKRNRAILFDQRGCGQSLPYGELKQNNMELLVSDIEALRKERGIEKWIVLGGSWGSTLALAYAEKYPQRVLSLVVTGVFLARAVDLDWWWNGTRSVFPEVWQHMKDFLPPQERRDLRKAYNARILNPDPSIHVPAIQSLLRYEVQVLDVMPNAARLAGLLDSANLIAMGKLYMHYDGNNFFLRENELLENSSALAGVPGFIINGRFDGITPPAGAYDLSKMWPDGELQIVPLAGHTWDDPLLAQAIVAAIKISTLRHAVSD